MALLDLPQRDSKEKIIKKAKAPQRTVSTVISGIDQVRQRVDANLGKYAEKYRVIMDLESLNKYVDGCLADGIVSIDNETTGLDPITDRIVGISLKSPSQLGVYIPINHISTFTRTRIDKQLTEKQIYEPLKRLVDGLGTVWHNAKFDTRFFKWQLNIDIQDQNIYWDTLIGSHLLNENEPHGLKYLYSKYILNLGGKEEEEIFKYSDLFEGMNFAEVPIDTAYIYAAHDAEMTLELYMFQRQYLEFENIEKNNQYSGISYVFNYIEMPAIKVICDMEDEGVKLDTNFASELSEKYHKQLEEAQQNFYNELKKYEPEINAYMTRNPGKLSVPINYSSPKQLATLLYDILKIEAVDKESPRGTGEEILVKMNLPIGNAILKCREIEKLLGTYIDKLPKDINPKTGKIHATFNPIGTVTGRFSSSNPNLQNIPSYNKEIRKMFTADDGYVLVGSDYSQQEPRILAHMSGDQALIDAYKQGKDIYAWVASLVYKVPYEECLEFNPDGTKNPKGKERRSTLKAIVLGVMYSKTAASIAEALNITREEAEKVYSTFFKTFPKVKDFIDSSQTGARKTGYVETAWGRKRRLPDMTLDEYEFSVMEGAVENFDPLNFEEQKQLELTEDIKSTYLAQFKKAFGYKKINEIIKQAESRGIKIKQNTKIIEDAKRQCVNSRIQGSAADMVKSAMINLHRNKELKDLGFKLLLTVHDEIIGQAPYENRERAGQLLSEIMIKTSLERISVPMKCDVEITKNWTGEEVK